MYFLPDFTTIAAVVVTAGLLGKDAQRTVPHCLTHTHDCTSSNTGPAKVVTGARWAGFAVGRVLWFARWSRDVVVKQLEENQLLSKVQRKYQTILFTEQNMCEERRRAWESCSRVWTRYARSS